ncbi:DUF2218 domain-containing protein [Blastococcus sp. CCUG 61487]|uniref:DUF2218 domain-containing protein n=1 Tax=Blastococcus sp. CCUG 61487 TaxID=1840703 RepID=UPI0010C10B6A|nr:DUF2218 domain-containing protein [Blastococcus sp. CCUG 61487]TKJ32848.1 hypothetical protein A6V29_16580 [Blastococcus sp. CCUG 61487]
MTAPLRASADVRTDNPARYAKQLVSHLGRKLEFTTEGGTSTASFFDFGTGSIVLGDGVLTLVAESATPEGLARVQHVLGDHLERFGARDSLTVSWAPEPGLAPAAG